MVCRVGRRRHPACRSSQWASDWRQRSAPGSARCEDADCVTRYMTTRTSCTYDWLLPVVTRLAPEVNTSHVFITRNGVDAGLLHQCGFGGRARKAAGSAVGCRPTARGRLLIRARSALTHVRRGAGEALVEVEPIHPRGGARPARCTCTARACRRSGGSRSNPIARALTRRSCVTSSTVAV